MFCTVFVEIMPLKTQNVWKTKKSEYTLTKPITTYVFEADVISNKTVVTDVRL